MSATPPPASARRSKGSRKCAATSRRCWCSAAPHDKNAEEIVAALAPAFSTIICAQARHKGRPAAEIAAIAAAHAEGEIVIAESMEDARRLALARARAPDGAVYVAGGLFLAVEFKAIHQGATLPRWPSFEPRPGYKGWRRGDMPRSLFEHLSPDTGPKRIFALDGGGVKGVLALGMLKPLEDELRRRAGGHGEFRLCDYYDLIGGTSTGSIIAAGLALGLSVDELIDLYMRLGPEVFGRTAGDGVFLQSKFEFEEAPPRAATVLSTKTLGSQESAHGSRHLRQAHRHRLAWVVTNHPLGEILRSAGRHAARFRTSAIG